MISATFGLPIVAFSLKVIKFFIELFINSAPKSTKNFLASSLAAYIKPAAGYTLSDVPVIIRKSAVVIIS